MSELTAPEAFTVALELARAQRAILCGPRYSNGKFMGRECPICDSGSLQYDGYGCWRCDGLADPDHPDKPLEACDFAVFDLELEQPSECRCGRPMNALADICEDCEAKFTTDGEWEPEQDL